MKRSIIALAALGILSFATNGASAATVEQDTATVFVQDQRKEIMYEELPDAVSTTFEESEYAAWEVSKVEEVTTDDGMQYELAITDGSQSMTLTFDEEGNMVE